MRKRAWLDPFRFFEEGSPFLRGRFKDFLGPVVDSFETENEVVVTAELPGVEKQDIKLHVTDEGISIKVARKEAKEKEEKEEKKGYYAYYSSSRFEGFSEYVSFEVPVDASKTKASFKNGVLEVRIPKKKVTGGREVKID